MLLCCKSENLFLNNKQKSVSFLSPVTHDNRTSTCLFLFSGIEPTPVVCHGTLVCNSLTPLRIALEMPTSTLCTLYVFKLVVKGQVNFEKVKLQSNVTTYRANRRKNGETEMGYTQKWNFTLLLLHASDLTAV